MKLKDVYEIIEKNPTWTEFLGDMLDVCFPDEHEAYHMLSEGGDECCLDALWGSVGQDFVMPKEFDLLIDGYKKYHESEQWDKMDQLIEGLKNPKQ